MDAVQKLRKATTVIRLYRDECKASSSSLETGRAYDLPHTWQLSVLVSGKDVIFETGERWRGEFVMESAWLIRMVSHSKEGETHCAPYQHGRSASAYRRENFPTFIIVSRRATKASFIGAGGLAQIISSQCLDTSSWSFYRFCDESRWAS